MEYSYSYDTYGYDSYITTDGGWIGSVIIVAMVLVGIALLIASAVEHDRKLAEQQRRAASRVTYRIVPPPQPVQQPTPPPTPAFCSPPEPAYEPEPQPEPVEQELPEVIHLQQLPTIDGYPHPKVDLWTEPATVVPLKRRGRPPGKKDTAPRQRRA